MSSTSTPPDGYFNDLSQPTGKGNVIRGETSPGDMNNAADAAATRDSGVPKPKRIACIICRKRKLKCDGTKPSCSTCTRLGHSCAYDEFRRKSGPKRGYVKALEERLKQVETLLKTQDPVPATSAPDPIPASFSTSQGAVGNVGLHPILEADFNVSASPIGVVNGVEPDRWQYPNGSPQQAIDDISFPADINMGMGIEDTTFTWEMIGLGLDEPLPPQESIDELHQIYFDKVHPSLPMIHKYRYLAAMNLAPNQRPPVALRYAMWTLAASVVEKYMDLRDHFYRRARKYMEMDEMKGHGEHMITVAHCQAHILLASYEFKMMYFPRAWMSTGAAVRQSQMMGLHRLDGVGLDVKQCLPPPRDWTEREERRRTFWMAFCEDRYASIGTGWPMTYDEKDILSDLPASDEAYEMSKPERTQSLADALTPSGAAKLSPFAGVCLMACLFGRNLIHLHRPDADDRDNDLNGEFWKRHRLMDNILLNTALSMPSHLKLPAGISNPNIVFTNMNIHTSTICLHQAAIYKADKNRLPSSISAESKVRCITAATEIASIMRMVAHMDLSSMNPFISFCLYVSARVFVQYLKSRQDDSQTADSLRFLLSAMNALKKKNPLTESFLVQLAVDLESLGLRHPKYKALFEFSDDHLGLTTAKAPEMVTPNGNTIKNECCYIVDPKNMDPETNANGITPPNGDQHGWLNDDQEVQRTLQGLALGSIPKSSFRTTDYINSTSESSISAEPGLSPDTAHSSSNRPTPNSTTPSETRSNLQSGPNASGRTSYETSPVSSHKPSLTSGEQHSQGQVRPTNAMDAFFTNQPDYGNMSTSNLMGDNAFTMPETPARFPSQSLWELGRETTGLTPVGDGVFSHLMGMQTMDVMDMGWDEHQ